MKEVVVIVWAFLGFAMSFLMMFVLKKQLRKLGKWTMIANLITVLLTFGISFLVYRFFYESAHLIWVSRLTLLVLGGLFVWFIYSRPWTIRHAFDFAQDAFAVEFMFILLTGLLVSIAFVSAPQVFQIVPYPVDVSATLWEGPLYFVLPFLIVKLFDFSGQVPFRNVENPWVFPLERVNVENWPWRDLMQVNFEIRRSLLDEYNLFTWGAKPWIEAPKEVSLGQIFRLVVQERRQRRELSSIQDLGDEYDGAPRFVWLFSFKRIWYNPITWFRNPKFLNPDFSISQNKIKRGDVILARRIPGDGSKPTGINYDGIGNEDLEKTIIIKK